MEFNSIYSHQNGTPFIHYIHGTQKKSKSKKKKKKEKMKMEVKKKKENYFFHSFFIQTSNSKHFEFFSSSIPPVTKCHISIFFTPETKCHFPNFEKSSKCGGSRVKCGDVYVKKV